MAQSQEISRLKLIFMGTPDFAAVSLAKVIESGLAESIVVYTQPDRPCGRGHKCMPSPVKSLALEHGLTVRQPLHFKNSENVAELASFSPDILLVAAYGLILPQTVLDIPRFGPWNIHASLLPKYRGAAPIQRAIWNGEHETGITIMRMEAGLDTGPMLLRRSVPIAPDETSGSLHDRLALLGAECAIEALSLFQAGVFSTQPQDEMLATYASKISKADCFIDWNQPSSVVHNQVRALSPKPGANFFLRLTSENREIRLQTLPGTFTPSPHHDQPGRVLGLSDGKLRIACSSGEYLLSSIKPAGKSFMSATAFVCGYLQNFLDGQAISCGAPDSFTL